MKKLSIANVLEYFQSQGCLLTSTTFTDARTPLSFVCACGCEGSVTWSSFRYYGRRCQACQEERNRAAHRLSIEDVAALFRVEGCELLETRYAGNDVPLRYKCSCGAEATVMLLNFKNGARCKECGQKKHAAHAASRRHDFETVKRVFTEGGCELLEKDYTSIKAPMKYRCECGQVATTTFRRFSNGGRCAECSSRNSAETQRMPLELLAEEFLLGGCELLEDETTFVNTKQLLRYRCSCGVESKIRLMNFRRGNRCDDCGRAKISGPNHYKWNPDRDAVELRNQVYGKCLSFLHRIRDYIKFDKTASTMTMMGYTLPELIAWLEAHPDSHLVRDSGWHLDHVIPVKAFIDHGITDLKMITSLSNLRPCRASENLSKGGRYKKEDFLAYVESYSQNSANSCNGFLSG